MDASNQAYCIHCHKSKRDGIIISVEHFAKAFVVQNVWLISIKKKATFIWFYS